MEYLTKQEIINIIVFLSRVRPEDTQEFVALANIVAKLNEQVTQTDDTSASD